MKRNRWMIMTPLLLLLLLATGGCQSGSKPSATVPQQPSTPAATDATVAIACEIFPPFSYQEDGQVKGIFIDLVREAFRRSGTPITITAYPWARAIAMLENGETDALCTIYKSAQRETFADFSQAVVPDIQSLFVRREAEFRFDGSLESLRGRTIGTVEGYSYGETFDEAFKNGTLRSEPVNLIDRNVEKLLDGRIDMFVEGKYVALYTMKKMGVAERVRELEPDVRRTQLYLAFSKKRNRVALLTQFNEALDSMKKDGTYQKIIDRYAQ